MKFKLLASAFVLIVLIVIAAAVSHSNATSDGNLTEHYESFESQ